MLKIFIKLFLGVMLICWFVIDISVIIGINNYLLYLYLLIILFCLASYFCSFIGKIRKYSYIVFILSLVLYTGLNFIPQISSRFAKDTCYDNGNVWDEAENRCRKDCLLISKKLGCIKMASEHIILLEECVKNPNLCDRKLERKYYNELCAKYNLPIDPKTNLCNFN